MKGEANFMFWLCMVFFLPALIWVLVDEYARWFRNQNFKHDHDDNIRGKYRDTYDPHRFDDYQDEDQ